MRFCEGSAAGASLGRLCSDSSPASNGVTARVGCDPLVQHIIQFMCMLAREVLLSLGADQVIVLMRRVQINEMLFIC